MPKIKHKGPRYAEPPRRDWWKGICNNINAVGHWRIGTREGSPKQFKLKRAIVVLLIACTISCGFQGCAKAIVAKSVESRQASYDGNVRNSGIIGIAPGGGRIVTQHYRERYNALIADYGSEFKPPLKEDEGFDFTAEGDRVVIDKEHHIKFGIMLQWKRDGRKPAGTFQKLIKKVTG